MMLQELRSWYDQGKTEEVLEKIAAMSPKPSGPEYADLVTLKGWCHYRRKEYVKAHDAALAAGSHRWARELLAYVYAYAPGYVNDEELRRIAAEIGHDAVNIANAFVIRARAPDCVDLTHEEVAQYTDRFQGGTDVSTANLFHNAGRFFLDKARQESDLGQAITYLDRALALYGQEANWHHRAAAQYWKSVAVERQDGKDAAVPVAVESLRLWEKQVSLDPTNASFKEKCSAANKRLAQLRS